MALVNVQPVEERAEYPNMATESAGDARPYASYQPVFAIPAQHYLERTPDSATKLLAHPSSGLVQGEQALC